MPDQPVSRRTVAFALAGGVVGAKLMSSSAEALEPGATIDDASAHAGAAPLPRERRLLAPLTEGSRLLSWEVVAIEPLAMGTVKVQLRGESGATFGVEVLARDASPLSKAPPAQTQKFAVYVSNGGDGYKPTAEEQGLAAMALAQIVARNETHVSAEGFLTHGARLVEHPVALLHHVDGSTLEGPFDPATARA